VGEENPLQVHESLWLSQLLSKLRQSPWALPIVVSVGLVIPCFWQPIVSSVDLQSHLYNAWLAELIRGGSIRGLWIGHQSTNLVVDMLFSWLLKPLGVSGAERVVTTALVLIFFWGAFRFISAVRRQSAYWLVPWLAILSYGFAFQCGLLNYYFSCGVVLWLLAILWNQRVGLRMLWATPLLILAYLAHPLPVLWLLGVAAYCQLAQRLQVRFQILLFISSAIVISLIRTYIVAKYLTIWMPRQLVYWTGADQALLYGWIYLAVAVGFLLFCVILLSEPENRWRAITSVPAQAYFLTAIAIVLVPSAIRGSIGDAWASRIADRLSLFSGVLLLAIVARSAYRRWYLPAGLVAAAIFFAVLHSDIGREAAVVARMQTLVQALPTGERVVSYDHAAEVEQPADHSTTEGKLTHLSRRLSSIFTNRLNSMHLLSRACLGHCFDYMDYEPSTGQFRIHAVPGNYVVVASYPDVVDMMDGTYAAKASDLPLFVLLRCGADPDDIHMLALSKGESGEMLACPRTNKGAISSLGSAFPFRSSRSFFH
jgi:hypothetical protein